MSDSEEEYDAGYVPPKPRPHRFKTLPQQLLQVRDAIVVV